MSSSRKRASLKKAHVETENLRMRLQLVERHYNEMTFYAKLAAEEADTWRRHFPEHEYRRHEGVIAAKSAPNIDTPVRL